MSNRFWRSLRSRLPVFGRFFVSQRPGVESMARPEKVAVVEEVRERLESAPATVLTEYRGLTVAELAKLRAELRKSGAEYRVVKNTLTRIAAREAGLDVPDEVLTGPTEVTFAGEDPVAA